MAILRVGNDNRSEDQRLMDEAVRTRVEVHRRLKLPGETEDADPVKHISGCEDCLKELREHAEGCGDGKKLLERIS